MATDDEEDQPDEGTPEEEATESPEEEATESDDTPTEDEVDPRDTRIAELEAVVGELTAALEAANERVAELSEGLIKVSGDVDQDARDEVTPPAPSLLGIMKQFAS